MLIPLNLWRAEWHKSALRPFDQILLSSTLALLCAFFIVTTLLALFQPDRFLASARQLLPYPHNLTLIAQFSAIVGQLLAALFVATSIGSEYSGDTWKMVLPRYGDRLAFLFAKVGVGAGAIALLLGLMLVLGIPLSLAGAALLGLPASEPFTLAGLLDALLAVAISAVPMALYGAATLFATVATRTPLAGAMLGFFGLQTVALLAPLYGPLALLMPYPHLANITEHYIFHDPATVQRIALEFGGPVAVWFSLLVIGCYTLGFLAAAALIFQRRDQG